MTLDELREEIKNQDQKALDAYLDFSLPTRKSTMNPWFDKKYMFLEASVAYHQLSITLDWVKRETGL